jgi:hypothetical protein
VLVRVVKLDPYWAELGGTLVADATVGGSIEIR